MSPDILAYSSYEKLKPQFLGVTFSKMNSPLQSEYQRLYNVVLLDDLHNYFPALLYEPEAFQNVPQVLAYIRRQTQRTFNPLAWGARQYQAQRPVVNVPVNLNPNAMSAFEALLEASLLLNPRATVGVNNINTNATNFMAPVRVSPSAGQIAAGTRLESVMVEGEVCPVCQDGLAIADEKRVINACNHGFHRACIDTWFEENVHCPVCRHDVRETVA